MKSFLRASRVAAAIFVSLAFAGFGVVGHSVADTTPSQATILPVCYGSSDGPNLPVTQAEWTVTNNNTSAVTIGWTTDNSASTGTWTIPAGTASFNTDFGSTDTAVKFVQNGISQVISNIIPCSPNFQDSECIDASVPDEGLTETWTSINTVQLSTPDNVPVCPDTTITLTSYTLPTKYDGNFFPGNATSVPQTVLDSQTVTLTNAITQDGEFQYPTFNSVTLTVKLPTDVCANYRVSLYYGNASGNVTTAAYGNNYLGGGLYQAASTCPAPTTPQVLGASTTAPTLTDTGLNIRFTSVIAAILMASAIVIFRAQPKAAK
jgi:hypothetical protein